MFYLSHKTSPEVGSQGWSDGSHKAFGDQTLAMLLLYHTGILKKKILILKVQYSCQNSSHHICVPGILKERYKEQNAERKTRQLFLNFSEALHSNFPAVRKAMRDSLLTVHIVSLLNWDLIKEEGNHVCQEGTSSLCPR